MIINFFLFLLVSISCMSCFFFYAKIISVNEEKILLLKIIDKKSDEIFYLKNKIDDLKRYQEDVSRTFKILDNELVAITEKIDKHTSGAVTVTTQRPQNPISLLNPELLNEIFANLNSI